MNVSRVLSQVPLSAKYLHQNTRSEILDRDMVEITDNNVLKNITTNRAKNPIASNACLDLLTDKYMTSIVLTSIQSEADKGIEGHHVQ